MKSFIESFSQHYESIALIDGPQKVRFSDLSKEVKKVAEYLTAVGINPGDRIGIILPNCAEFIFAVFAVQSIGAVPVLMNPAYPKDELSWIRRHSGTAGYFMMEDNALNFTKSILSEEQKEDLRGIALMIYTSGTTGESKGVMLTADNLKASIDSWIDAVNITSDDNVLVTLPLFHIFGFTLTLLATLKKGGTCVIQKSFTPQQTATLIKNHRCTVFAGVPTMYSYLAQSKLDPIFFQSLRLCISGGSSLPEPVRKSFEQAFRQPILEGYGLSEASPLVSVNRPNNCKPGSVGLPVKNVIVQIIANDGSPLPSGETGEIAISGPNITPGYFRNPEATEQALISGMLQTGDIGFLDNEGFLTITDRKKDLIITGGYNVSPIEVENLLASLEGVAEAAVCGVPHAQKGECVKGFVTMKPEVSFNEKELVEQCKGRLAHYKVPVRIEETGHIPRNASGKVLRRMLKIRTVCDPSINMREFRFESAGASLSAKIFLPAESQEAVKPVILTCGIGGRKDWFEPTFPDAVVRRGYALVTYDIRGHFPSEGIMDGNVDRDLPALIETLETMKEVNCDSIILAGQCLGMLLCADYAADNPNRIKGLANISSFVPSNADGFFRKATNELVMKQIRRSKTHNAEIDTRSFFNDFAGTINVRDKLAALSDIPMLFVHYEDDPICPASMVRDFTAPLPGKQKELVTLPFQHKSWITTVPHAASYDDPAVATSVINWIERNF